MLSLHREKIIPLLYIGMPLKALQKTVIKNSGCVKRPKTKPKQNPG